VRDAEGNRLLLGETFAGGEKGRCGWLKDKFGVSWQIVPPILGELLYDEDDEKSNRVMQAMLKMDKIEIKGLKQAYDAKGKIIKTNQHKSKQKKP
jgi:predicted 3-demethylubiquinone-9 3-methyltransferase (glyoxalase superfamily)